jgi:hypothetical protein
MFSSTVVFFSLNFDFEHLEQKFVFKSSVVNPDPHWIRIQLFFWIRIELKCWIRIRVESIRIHKPANFHIFITEML